MKKVAIIQTRLTSYRLEFFEGLKQYLLQRNISLTLFHGKPNTSEKMRNDEGAVDWATQIRNFSLRLFGIDFIWQALPWKTLSDFDLIVLQQENRILSNYLILLLRLKKNHKMQLAFWGHGRNFQSKHPTGWRERFKKLISLKVDWWFAYTKITKKILEERGFPEEQIVLVNNSTNTNYLSGIISAEEVNKIKQSLSFEANSKIGLFCGNLTHEKKINLLIETCQQVKKYFVNFFLIVMGSGALTHLVKDQSDQYPWIRFVGRLHGKEKAQYFSVSDFLVGPGMVGLNIVDGFAAGLPLVTTESHNHSPEIAYLENGLNGLMTPETRDDFLAGIVSLLHDPIRLANMRLEALKASQKYSLDNMVTNFGEGIVRALN